MDEAEKTVRKTDEGKYYDLTQNLLNTKGNKRLSTEDFMNIMSKIRLRYTLTPNCNIWCSFCSNEGLSYDSKKNKSANIDLVIKLSDILIQNTPLKSIDFSGGEPTLHPDFTSEEFKLVSWTKNTMTSGFLYTPMVPC